MNPILEQKLIEPILILHLSDLHFGPNSRFCDSDPKELGQKFYQALEIERNKRRIDTKISLVIVTGDITERARLEEYDKAKDFFDILSEKLEIGHERFIFVPGNHDVYWVACKRAELDQEESNFSDEELRKRINSEKFENFEKFLEGFYGIPQDQIGVDLNYDGFIYNLDDLKLSVAGLNSSEIESHRTEDHRGSLSEGQAQSLMNKWHEDKLNSWLKIIAIHHNPAPTVPQNVRDGIKYLEKLEEDGKLKSEDVQRFASDAVGFEGRENLKRVAEDCRVQLILHGHHHAAEQEAWTWRGQQSGITNILSAGSWGLIPDELPKNQPNNLQLILLNPVKKELRSWTLVYDPRVRTEGIVALGNFTSDPANPDGYCQQLSLPDGFKLDYQEQPKEQKENSDDIMEAKTEIQASPKIYYPKPYLLQKHFTGRVKYRQILTEWLTRGNNPIFVLTGLSGSGKSALTWIWFQHDVVGSSIDDLLPDPTEAAEGYCVPESARPQGVIWWSFYEKEARFSEFLEKSVTNAQEH
jgi:3',5'-cyclic AMP phosphodiesterase CpdA